MKQYVIGLGEVLWDCLPEGKKLGGAPANFAYHAGQFLGSENTVAISALGEDALADETEEALFDNVYTNQSGAQSRGGSNFHFILGQEF